jgi:hypothetical protein
MRRIPVSPWLVLGLAFAIHVDWHLARPTHGHHARLSFDCPQHWVFAIPVFALAAWIVWRRWPDRLLAASVANLGLAIVAAQVLEPLAEQVGYFHRVALGIEPLRWMAFFAFVATGLLAYACTLNLLRIRGSSAHPSAAV